MCIRDSSCAPRINSLHSRSELPSLRGLPDKINTFFIGRSSFEVLSFSGSSIAQVCISRNLHFVHLFELKGSNNPLDPLIATLRVSFRSSASFVKRKSHCIISHAAASRCSGVSAIQFLAGYFSRIQKTLNGRRWIRGVQDTIGAVSYTHLY